MELAEQLDENTDVLLERWDGRPDYVIEDVFRVRDLETKKVGELDLTDYQRQFVHGYFYGDADELNVLKGRRTGYSFISSACILLDAIRSPHGFYAITAPSMSQAKDRLDDIYDLMEWSPLNFDPPIDNRDEIKLSNSSTIMAFSGNPDTSRGADSADVLFVDEKDFLEDQEESMRAFAPFTALGDSLEVSISTPRLSNSLFMQDQKRGSPEGNNGIIAIEQSAFENPDEVDPHVPLYDQDVETAMPYLNLDKAEKARARDPMGFKQEYLCVPVDNTYRFFDEETVQVAAEAGEAEDYSWGPTVGPQFDESEMVLSVDIAGGGKDDTAIVIVEHAGDQRFLRYHEAVTDTTLHDAGITPANTRNPSAIADRISMLYGANDIDMVVTDATNIGEGFDSEIRQQIGRGVNSFNFSDKESVEEMMGDVNYGFHNGQITLVDDDTLCDQILAIEKQQTHKSTKPRFTGKDAAPEGKDDLAIAFALAAYPPNASTDGKELQSKDEHDVPENPVEENKYGFEIEETGNSGSKVAQVSRGRYTGSSERYERRYSR
jgi:hypothetical protein